MDKEECKNCPLIKRVEELEKKLAEALKKLEKFEKIFNDKLIKEK